MFAHRLSPLLAAFHFLELVGLLWWSFVSLKKALNTVSSSTEQMNQLVLNASSSGWWLVIENHTSLHYACMYPAGKLQNCLSRPSVQTPLNLYLSFTTNQLELNYSPMNLIVIHFQFINTFGSSCSGSIISVFMGLNYMYMYGYKHPVKVPWSTHLYCVYTYQFIPWWSQPVPNMS